MEVLAVVRQLRDLAANPDHRVLIVRDQGCLPGLVLFLDNADGEVVATALDALRLLSECHANRAVMHGELGMTVSLQGILDRPNSADGRLHSLARQVLENITPAPRKATETDSFHKTLTRRHPQNGTEVGTPNGQSFFAGHANRRAHTITLSVEGLMDVFSRQAVESALLRVKGVVSFTFEMHRARVVVRARTDVGADAIAAAIHKGAQMTCQLVSKNERGEEVLSPLAAGAPSPVADKENTSAAANEPDYLPEDDSAAAPREASKGAVARTGDKGKAAGGWLSSFGGYIARTLYW